MNSLLRKKRFFISLSTIFIQLSFSTLLHAQACPGAVFDWASLIETQPSEAKITINQSQNYALAYGGYHSPGTQATGLTVSCSGNANFFNLPPTSTTAPTLGGSKDAFLSVLDLATGQPFLGINLNWSIISGTAHDYKVTSAQFDSTGNLFFSGYYIDWINLNFYGNPSNWVSPQITGNTDAYITKVDSTGQILWNKTLSTGTTNPSYVHINKIFTISSNVYVVGNFMGTVNFGTAMAPNNLTSSSSLYEDAFIAQLDTASGGIFNLLTFPPATMRHIYDITVDPVTQNLILVGDATLNAFLSPFAIIQIDPNQFSIVYSSNFASSGSQNYIGKFSSISIDNAQNIYLTGSLEGTADLDPSSGTNFLTGSMGGDMLTVKYNIASGNPMLLWANRIYGYGIVGGSFMIPDFGTRIRFNSTTGKLIVAGITSRDNAGLGITGAGNNQSAFLARLNPNTGALIASKYFTFSSFSDTDFDFINSSNDILWSFNIGSFNTQEFAVMKTQIP